MSTVVLYCWCHSDSASVLLYFTTLVCHGLEGPKHSTTDGDHPMMSLRRPPLKFVEASPETEVARDMGMQLGHEKKKEKKTEKRHHHSGSKYHNMFILHLYRLITLFVSLSYPQTYNGWMDVVKHSMQFLQLSTSMIFGFGLFDDCYIALTLYFTDHALAAGDTVFWKFSLRTWTIYPCEYGHINAYHVILFILCKHILQ